MTDWPGWLGMGTGLLGFGLAIISYRRAGRLKKIDLTVDLGHIDNEVINRFEVLREVHSPAMRARQRMAAALGLVRSGAMVKWQQEWDADLPAIDDLEQSLPDSNARYLHEKPEAVARFLVERDDLLKQIERLVSKYEGWAEWNEKQSEHLRKAAEARINR